MRVDGTGAAELKRMYVASEARGLGLGEALLRDAVVAARRLGAHRLWLETSSILMPSAFRLYEAAGFAHGPADDFADQPGALTMSLDLRTA